MEWECGVQGLDSGWSSGGDVRLRRPGDAFVMSTGDAAHSRVIGSAISHSQFSLLSREARGWAGWSARGREFLMYFFFFSLPFFFSIIEYS